MAHRTTAAERDETPSERADRNLQELLQELRVALPGVQVLFAFLLIVPFNQRFGDVTPAQEKIYFGVLLCTAFSAALLIAPSMNHRLLFRQGDKDHIVKIANKLTILGLTLLAVAMCGVIVLITDFVFDGATAAVAAAALGVTFLMLWYAMPLQRRARLDGEAEEDERREVRESSTGDGSARLRA
jgi:peptidoglycan/LPS O-acetylase OafA/YrhL